MFNIKTETKTGAISITIEEIISQKVWDLATFTTIDFFESKFDDLRTKDWIWEESLLIL